MGKYNDTPAPGFDFIAEARRAFNRDEEERAAEMERKYRELAEHKARVLKGAFDELAESAGADFISGLPGMAMEYTSIPTNPNTSGAVLSFRIEDGGFLLFKSDEPGIWALSLPCHLQIKRSTVRYLTIETPALREMILIAAGAYLDALEKGI